jgi:hypothetical protein
MMIVYLILLFGRGRRGRGEFGRIVRLLLIR